MSLQPLTQPTSDEYQTWPMMRVRSAWSGGWGSPMARMMMPSMTAPICCWHSMAAMSGEASEAKTAATSWGWRPMARRARSRTSRTRSEAVGPAGRHLGQAGVELLHPEDEGRGEQVVLGGEVAVDGAHGHVRPGGHVPHLHRLVAALEAELHGSVDDPLTPRFLSAGQGAGKHSLLHGHSRYSRSCLERNPFYFLLRRSGGP